MNVMVYEIQVNSYIDKFQYNICYGSIMTKKILQQHLRFNTLNVKV